MLLALEQVHGLSAESDLIIRLQLGVNLRISGMGLFEEGIDDTHTLQLHGRDITSRAHKVTRLAAMQGPTAQGMPQGATRGWPTSSV